MIWRNWIRPYVYTVLLIGVVFQLWCLAWVGLYGVGLAPYTAFMKSEQARLMTTQGQFMLERDWVDYGQISDNLKRAVITSEDAGFVEHDGVDWTAIEAAQKRNEKAGKAVAGGSTISMQLTKNLFLSSNTIAGKAGKYMSMASAPKASTAQRMRRVRVWDWLNMVFKGSV
jgi:monofunctional biosynthetic peptidoglycan transglycosylase